MNKRQRKKLYRKFKPTWINQDNITLSSTGQSFVLTGATLKEYISPTVGRFTLNNL